MGNGSKTGENGIRDILDSIDGRQSRNACIIEDVRACLKTRSLALFLGAGVSMDANVPDWQALLREMTLRLCPPVAGDKMVLDVYYHLCQGVPLALGQQIEAKLGARFKDELRQVIYSSARRSPVLEAIARLCRKAASVPRVVTYNYDVLLEETLDAAGVAYRSVTGPADAMDDRVLNVVHIHGCLPRGATDDGDVDVVLGEQRYYRLWNSPFDWVNVEQLTSLLQYHALFIGFSFNDPNVRRLLELSMRHVPGKRHYAVLRRVHSDDLVEAVEGALTMRGEAADGRTLALRKLAEVAGSMDWISDMQEELYTSLGLQVLWVDEYSDLPELIDGLAE